MEWLDYFGRARGHCFWLAGKSRRKYIQREINAVIWWIMIGCGLFTFAARFVMFSGIAPKQLPNWLEDALSYVPLAVLTAIIVPEVFLAPTGGLHLDGNLRLPASIIAISVALITKSVLMTITVGLGSLWILNWF